MAVQTLLGRAPLHTDVAVNREPGFLKNQLEHIVVKNATQIVSFLVKIGALCISDSKCHICEPPADIDSDGETCKNCVAYCKVCDPNENDKCSECKGERYLNELHTQCLDGCDPENGFFVQGNSPKVCGTCLQNCKNKQNLVLY